MLSRRNTCKPFKCDRGPIYQVTNLNRNLRQLRPSEIHCQPDPTERNGSLRHVTTRNVKDLSKMCFDHLEKQPGFSSNWPSLKFPLENQCVVAS